MPIAVSIHGGIIRPSGTNDAIEGRTIGRSHRSKEVSRGVRTVSAQKMREFDKSPSTDGV
jgi:hypothetical protein